MSQSQKTRWIKTAAIAFTVVLMFWWLSPRGVEVHKEGELARVRRIEGTSRKLTYRSLPPQRQQGPGPLGLVVRDRSMHEVILQGQAHCPVRPHG